MRDVMGATLKRMEIADALELMEGKVTGGTVARFTIKTGFNTLQAGSAAKTLWPERFQQGYDLIKDQFQNFDWPF